MSQTDRQKKYSGAIAVAIIVLALIGLRMGCHYMTTEAPDRPSSAISAEDIRLLDSVNMAADKRHERKVWRDSLRKAKKKPQPPKAQERSFLDEEVAE